MHDRNRGHHLARWSASALAVALALTGGLAHAGDAALAAIPAAGEAAAEPPASRPIPLPPAALAGESLDLVADRPIAAPNGSLAGEAVRTGVALAGVIALILVGRSVLRRFGDPLAARRPSGVVQVLARFPFAKGQSIVLLSVGTRVLCLHHTASGTATLCAFTDPDEIAALRSRLEAGDAARVRFDRELERSLERSPERASATSEPSGQRGGRRPEHAALLAAIPTAEVVDLTRRSGRRSPFAALAGGGR
jgi:flagellar biogenesis protein FliO